MLSTFCASILDNRTKHFNDLLVLLLQMLCLDLQVAICFPQYVRLLSHLVFQL